MTSSFVARARRVAGRLRDERRRVRDERRWRRVARAAAGRPAPVVTEDRTNLGPRFDALVARARRNQLPVGVDADYDLVRERFDHLHFLLQAEPARDRPDLDPIAFFLKNGPRAVNSPDPDFSVLNYVERYPDRGAGPESPYVLWLKEGRAAGEIADPAFGIEEMAPALGLTPAQIVEELVAVRADLNERLRHGTLGEMFAKAAEIEPLIGAAWPEAARARLVPLGAKIITRQVGAIYECHRQAGFRPARLVVVTNRPRWGAGRRFEGHLAHSLAPQVAPQDVVVIHTDASGQSPEGRFPEGVRVIDFARAVVDLPEEAQARALVALLRSLQAEAIVNVNSALMYRTMVPFGRALAASERIFLMLFCNEQQAMGNWEGWSLSSFYPNFPHVAGVLTDSEYLREELRERYQLGDADLARVHVFPAPVEPEIALAAAPPARPRPVVFWAGRWDRQKRVDLAFEVARLMPDVDFRLWGERVLQGDEVGPTPPNLTRRPPYTALDQVPFEEADAWLYTSAWDGVPSLLLEVAMTGVPVVASRVGGVGEVLTEADGWLVSQADEPEAYVRALRELLDDPGRARERAHRWRDRLVAERSQAKYGALAVRVLLGQTGDVAR